MTHSDLYEDLLMYPLPVMVLWSLYCISGRIPDLADLWPSGMGYCAHEVPQKVFPPLRRLNESVICSLYFSLAHHVPFQYKIESWDFNFFIVADLFLNWNRVYRPSWASYLLYNFGWAADLIGLKCWNYRTEPSSCCTGTKPRPLCMLGKGWSPKPYV